MAKPIKPQELVITVQTLSRQRNASAVWRFAALLSRWARIGIAEQSDMPACSHNSDAGKSLVIRPLRRRKRNADSSFR